MSHGNGHSAQTFTANSNIKWRVLNVYYSSGEVTLISEIPLQTDGRTRLLFKWSNRGFICRRKTK